MLQGRQKFPVRTQKAIALVAGALVLDLLAAILLSGIAPEWTATLVVLQAPVLGLAWLAFSPVDRLLKQRVLTAGATARRRMGHVPVIAVAGSVGKTTTKELLTHLLQDLQPLATPAHVNTEMGVAAWLSRIEREGGKPGVLIVEMGAYRKGEIALLCRIAQPTSGILTALGSDHLALFGSEQAIIDANAEMLDALPPNGWAVVNGDSTGARAAAHSVRCPVTITGTESDAQPRAINLQETPNGLRFQMNGADVFVPLHGLHMIENVMLAVAAARNLGVSEARIVELLASFRTTQNTFAVRTQRGVTVLDDTYNISPLSFRAALTWAGGRPERPRVLVTAGLLETGVEEERFLRELGALAADSVERVIFLTDRGRETFAQAYGKPVELLSSATTTVHAGALLLCVGRMNPSTITRLLP